MTVSIGADTQVECQLVAEAENVDVRLQDSKIHFASTYITKATASTVRIWNRSDILVCSVWHLIELQAQFQWKSFATKYEEDLHKNSTKDTFAIKEREEEESALVTVFLRCKLIRRGSCRRRIGTMERHLSWPTNTRLALYWNGWTMV